MLSEKDGYVQLVQADGSSSDSVPSPDAGNSLLFATAEGLTVQYSNGNRFMLDLPVLVSGTSLPETITNTSFEPIVGLSYEVPDVIGASCLYQVDVVVGGTLTPDTTSTAFHLAISVNDGSPDVEYTVPSANPVDTAFGGSFRFFVYMSPEDVAQVVARVCESGDSIEFTFAVATLTRLVYID
jgi:hypothetical protein